MKKSYLLLHLAVVFAGFTGLFGKLISLNEGLLTWYRVLFSAVFLFVILKFLKINTKLETKEKIDIAKAGLLITTHWIFFYASIKYSNISVGVVCYSLTSFFTALYKPLLEKTPFVKTELLLSGITLLGISLIFHFDTANQLGIILGIISSSFAALYTIFNEKLVSKYDTKLINFYQMLAGSVVLGLLIPFYLQFAPATHILPTIKDAVYLLFLSLFCTVGLYVAFAEVLKKIPAFTVNLSFNLEPIYTITIAFLFFNEGKEVNFSFYLGLFFVILSVVLQTLISLRRSK